MTEDTLIRLIDVKRKFKLGDQEVDALRGVTADIRKGEFVVILGPSGSGKTTLLNQIGGIDHPTSGDVIVGSETISKYSEKELTKYRRRKVGWIFQFHNLIPSLTAGENVKLALEMAEIKQDQDEMTRKAMELVGLGGLENRFPAQLSGGQQQRVAIARAIVKNPEIIVADEATGNLDKTTGKQVIDVMTSICKEQGSTFCLVTHDPNLAHSADRLFIIDDGMLYENDQERMAMYGLA